MWRHGDGGAINWLSSKQARMHADVRTHSVIHPGWVRPSGDRVPCQRTLPGIVPDLVVDFEVDCLLGLDANHELIAGSIGVRTLLVTVQVARHSPTGQGGGE